MFVDDRDYPSWLKLHPYPTNVPTNEKTSTKSATVVPEFLQVARIASFDYWKEIHKEVDECRDNLNNLDGSDKVRASLTTEVEEMNLEKQPTPGMAPDSIGADDVAKDFAILVFQAKRALRVPQIMKDLRCDPRTIISKASTPVVWPSSLSASSSTSTVPVVVVREVKPDIGIYESRRIDEMLQLPIEAKRPSVRFRDLRIKPLTSSNKNAKRGSASDKTGPPHKVLANLFSRVRTSWAGVSTQEKVAALSVAQAIVYGLHSSSGCSLLTTFDETLLMKVSVARAGESKRWRLQIQVSNLYGSNTSFCALVGCLKYVFSNTFATKWTQRLQMMVSLDPDAKGRRSAKKNSQTKRGADTDTRTPQKKSQNDGSRGAGKSRSKCIANYLPAECEIVIDATMSESIGLSNAYQSFEKIDADELYSVMMSNSGFVDGDGCNKILRCKLDGMPVVAKYFCSFDERREISTIEHELRMHEVVENRCEDGEYGQFLSELVAYGELVSFGTVLLIAYLGHSVSKARNRFIIGCEIIEDTEALANAAVASLERLHDLGVSHGDIALRNMRAEKRVAGGWHVWWLDLGLAKDEENDETFQREALECRSLFDIC